MPQREVHLRDYLAILRKHDFIISLSFLLILGTAMIVSLRLPQTYVASTLILLVQPTSSPSVSSTSLFQSVLSGGVDRSEMETISQRFSTESMLGSAITKLENADIKGVRYLPSIGRLKQQVRAKIRPDTHYIELSLHLNAEEGGERNAALLTNQLVTEMQTLRSREERTKADHRRQLLDTKLSELLQQVKQQEERAFQFVSEKGSPATWYPQLASLLEQRAKLVEQQAQFEGSLKAAQLESNYLQKEMEKYPEYTKLSETISHHPIWLYQKEKLVDLESQRVGLEQQVGTNSPEIMALDAQIKEIRNGLANDSTDAVVTSLTHGPSPFYTGIKDQLINLQVNMLRAENNLNQVKPQLERVDFDLKHLIAKIPENELYLEKLRREINGTYELRKEIYKQSLEAEILLADSDYGRIEWNYRRITGGIEVVDSAVPRKIPVSPRINFIIAVAGIIGGAAGISIALMMEYFGKSS